MSTITKEQLRERARQKVKSLELAVTQTAFADSRAELEEELELARIALASLEAEPVSVNDDMAYAFHHAISDSSLGSDEVEEIKAGLRAAFANVTAPPAPASVPEWTNEQCLEFLSIAFRHAEIKGDLELDDIRLGVKMVNGSRAAMLQGAEPVTTAYKLPDGWVACSERMPEVGVKVLCFPVNDEPIHATYNGQVWLQDISWSVSDEPIDNVISCNVTHWMPLPAAPQQEVK